MGPKGKRKMDQEKHLPNKARRVKGEDKAGEASPGLAEDEAPLPQHPFVFFCLKCKAIIGDSLSMVCSNESLRIVTLRRGAGVSRQEVLKVSQDREEEDFGSTYFPIACEQCGMSLGRFYIVSPPALKELCQRLSLHVDKVGTYVLDSGDIGEKAEAGASALSARDTEGEGQGAEEGEELTDLEKVQHVVLAMELRLRYLEEQLAGILHPQQLPQTSATPLLPS